jgi:hypothetical protein
LLSIDSYRFVSTTRSNEAFNSSVWPRSSLARFSPRFARLMPSGGHATPPFHFVAIRPTSGRFPVFHVGDCIPGTGAWNQSGKLCRPIDSICSASGQNDYSRYRA